MNEASPLVSVIMPAYNAAKYIQEAINSIIYQSYTHWELIVVNDGSVDDTGLILRDMAKREPRVKIIEHSSNLGLIEARNRGIREAKGQYIANLDSDDLAFPNRLERQLNFLEAHKEYVAIGAECEEIDHEGKVIGYIKRDISDEDLKTLLLFNNYFVNSTVLMRAEAAKQQMYDKRIPLAEDYFFFIRLSKLGRLGNLKEGLVKYRVHTSNTSLIKERELNRSLEEIHRLQLVDCLGIEPSEEELRLHASIQNQDTEFNEAALKKLEKWLIKVIHANEKVAYYPKERLAYYGAFFYRRCCLRAKERSKARRAFFRSPLVNYLKHDFKGNIAFFVKSILNHR